MKTLPPKAAAPRHDRVSRRRVLWLLLGWCLATGAPWDLVQVFAWGRMWTGHLQTRSPVAALAATFDPQEICGICEVVQTARSAAEGRETPLPAAAEKSPLLPVPEKDSPLVEPAARTVESLRPGHLESRGRTRNRPPLPPPRLGL